MYLQSLYLRNFRVYTERRFIFSPKVNILLGPNAQGKTTVLEAIHLLMTGRSFRTPQIKDLIQHGASAFYVEAVFTKFGVEQSLAMSFNGAERKILYNHNPYPSVSGLLGLLQGAIMMPDDIELVKGSPKARRRFLDLQLAQIDPLYVHHLARYGRAMRHRNHLLRIKELSTIETWENEMAKAADYIVKQRFRALANLQGICGEVLRTLSAEREMLSLNYKTSAPDVEYNIGQMYLAHYKNNRRRELLLGNTLTGPHKDDFQIFIGGKEARYFASEGQQRSCVAALRFAEWQHLHQRSDDVPLMLIDDVGLSLDQSRREKLFSLVRDFNQVFLTATDVLSIEASAETINLGSFAQRG